MKQIALLFALLLGVMFTAFWLEKGGFKLPGKLSEDYKYEMGVGEKIIKVEIADTDLKLKRGLSGREKIEDEEGMLFVVPENSIPSFWMKDMKFPIDIIWIDDLKVIGVLENLPVPTEAESELLRYQPEQPIDYVLEVKTGFVKDNNIKIGDAVELPKEIR